jgi:triphosphoribosyl-dephospho-CoA synthase
VPTNVNLGIVLLAAPLLAAAEAGKGPLADRVAVVLRDLTVADAEDAFMAIRDAAPGGLGRAAEQDVAAAPTVSLRAAMALAAGRDRVARQYAEDYADIFGIGVPRIAAARRRGIAPAWTASLVYLDFLTRFPDSHIARKFGARTAERVRLEAEALRASLPESEAAAFPALLAFDRTLKERGLNPGTSADLTVAALLASGLADMLKAPASDIG